MASDRDASAGVLTRSTSAKENGALILLFNKLTIKKQYLFNRLQKTYDLSKRVVPDNVDVVELFMVQYAELENVRNSFEEIIMQIIEVELELNPDKSSSTTQSLNTFDDLYFACKLVALKYGKFASEVTPKGESRGCPSHNNSNEQVRAFLPKLTLFEFDGQLENWPTFHDTFVSLVHSRKFDDIDKFHYLLSCVKNTALNLIKNFPITGANYHLAWQSLVDKYQDRRALVGRYLDKMLNFAPLSKDTITNLTLFIETFDHSLKSINALEIKDLDDYLFCHLALRGLDPHTRKSFEEGRDQSELPTFSELMVFVNKQIKVLERTVIQTTQTPLVKSKSNTNNYNNATRTNQSKFSFNATATNNKFNNKSQTKLTCSHCKLDHMIYRCEQFRKLPINERIDRVNSLQLCQNCLKNNHDVTNCKSTMTCGVCASPHHYLLHRESGSAVPSPSSALHTHVTCRSVSDSLDAPARTDSEVTAPVEVLHSVNEVKMSYGVVLGTARVLISDVLNQYQDCRAVLDSGAQNSFMTLSCAQRLGLRRSKCPFTVCGLGGEVVKNYGITTCTIRPRDSNTPTLPVDMVVVGRVSSEMPNITFSQNVIDEYKPFKLADPCFYKRSSVDILLGNDIVPALIENKPLHVRDKIPNVMETIFGFIVSGKLYTDDRCTTQNFHLTSLSSEEGSLDRILRDFWEVEELPCRPILNPLDELAEETYAKQHYRDPTGRYVVPLPFMNAPPSLGDSHTAAARRLLHSERKLSQSPHLLAAYKEFMSEYEALDHMELYTGEAPTKYFIPHHSVYRPSSTSTPVRVVFDGSAKTSNNISLNDILLTGPKLYRDIVAIILNFRLFEFCFASDICKMYRAILVRECDRQYQHILYRKSTDSPMETYELKTVTYGLSCSPFLAIRTLLQLATDEGERFPSAARVIREGIYMDDILWSCETLSQACLLQDELIEMMKSAGLVLKKWSSNRAELLERVPEDSRECPITFMKDEHDFSVKVLGLQWTPLSDTYQFVVNKTDTETTKRSVLKILASIFDPMGFIAPCTFVAKCIMQDLWKLGIGWDERLPREICSRWLAYVAMLPRLSELRIERHALLACAHYELVGFCDASLHGYAACIYIISKDSGHNITKVRLLIAKSKVAPVKPITIPRLELMGAVLLCKLMKYLRDNLSRIEIKRVTALSDSSIVLAWLQTDAYKLKTFVSNRVTQIIDILPAHCWRHVASENNMADVCSRGATPDQFVSISQQWFNGPDWLYDAPADWPVTSFYAGSEEDIPEMKQKTNTFNLLSEQNNIDELPTEFCDRVFSRFSCYTKILRTFAWILIALRKTKASSTLILTTEHLNTAHDVIIKLIQNTYFSEEISMLSKGMTYVRTLRKLSPFLDEAGFLRVGGRITHSELPYRAKHPLLLPKGIYFNRLLIEHFHKKYLHAGPRSLHSIILQQYWIVNARSSIRSILSKCLTCFKCKPTQLQPAMGPLPATRLMPNKVFHNSGVDLGGPWLVKESLRRNARVYKAYLCLFICFSTKAVHLEVLSSLSADCFLAALDRFVARRGLCVNLYSDCGTNFVASSKHLNEVHKFFLNGINKDNIVTGCAERRIFWHFNPPSAPHMGGLWEAGIKSAKYHLTRAVGESTLTFEELSTIFCKIESILNSRPLVPLSNDPNEFAALTAGHFLIGRNLNSVPEYNVEDVATTRLSRWQFLQKCTQQFWRLWSTEYLNTLQQRAKWFSSPPNLKVGDLVLVKSDQLAPCNWPLARVEELHPGSDGVVRCVTLRTQKGIYKRPVNKCSPLPYQN